MPEGFVLLDNKYRVRVINGSDFDVYDKAKIYPTGDYDYLAVVFDYGDHFRVRFTTKENYKRGIYLKAFLYRA